MDGTQLSPRSLWTLTFGPLSHHIGSPSILSPSHMERLYLDALAQSPSWGPSLNPQRCAWWSLWNDSSFSHVNTAITRESSSEITPLRLSSLWVFSAETPHIIGEGPSSPCWISNSTVCEINKIIILCYCVFRWFLCVTLAMALWRRKDDMLMMHTYKIEQKNNSKLWNSKYWKKERGGWTSVSELNPYFIYPGIIK